MEKHNKNLEQIEELHAELWEFPYNICFFLNLVVLQ